MSENTYVERRVAFVKLPDNKTGHRNDKDNQHTLQKGRIQPVKIVTQIQNSLQAAENQCQEYKTYAIETRVAVLESPPG